MQCPGFGDGILNSPIGSRAVTGSLYEVGICRNLQTQSKLSGSFKTVKFGKLIRAALNEMQPLIQATTIDMGLIVVREIRTSYTLSLAISLSPPFCSP